MYFRARKIILRAQKSVHGNTKFVEPCSNYWKLQSLYTRSLWCSLYFFFKQKFTETLFYYFRSKKNESKVFPFYIHYSVNI